jgi:hypothetical protein
MVKFIPFENRDESFVLEQAKCENLIKFDIANEDGMVFDSITIND